MTTRRNFLFTAAATAAVSRLSGSPSTPPRTKMGIASTCYMTVRKVYKIEDLLDRAEALGAGGVQGSLSSTDSEYLKNIRARAERLGMYLEVMGSLPKDDNTAKFEATLAAAKQVGARCVRSACLGSRRYETFKDLAEWNTFVRTSHARIDRAMPIVEKHGVPLALENHKDWTADEMAALMKAKSNPLLGVCLDTGNNISLLDDPMYVIETLAPYAFCTHLKDMGVAPYEDGFLLSEVVLGTGILDLKRVVETIHKARPETRISLEMITRDPLKVPCFTDRYWATFPHRDGLYLARTVRLVRDRQSKQPLPTLEGLAHEAQLKVEQENIEKCLAYARAELNTVL